MSNARMQKHEKLDPRAIKRLLADTKRYWPLFGIAILLLLGSCILQVIAPPAIADVTRALADYFTAASMGIPGAVLDLDFIMLRVYTLAGMYAGTAILGYLGAFCITTAVQHYCHSLRRAIERKINVIPLNYFDTHATGDIMSRVTNDVDNVSQNLDQSISSIAQSAFLLVGSLIAMFATNWFMAIVACCTVPLLLLFMSFELKIAQPAFEKRVTMIGKVNGVVEEDYGGQNVIKLFNAEERRKGKFDKENKTLGKTMFIAQNMGGLMGPTTSLISNLGYAAVLIAGGLCTASDNLFAIDVGVISAFMTYIRLFQQPFTMIGQTLNALQTIGAASNRVNAFLGEEELEEEESKASYFRTPEGREAVKGEVVFDHVSFGYDPERTIIHDFSATVKPGMKVAIVGPTGAGKTTMVNLLMRFYEIGGGDIRIDGVSIKDMSREEIHDIFGMVLQDTWVFEGTYRENLVYNTPGVSDEEVYAAIKEAHLVHFTRSLPNGLDSVFGENNQVSAGQKQLITIARAMIRRSPLLILDEATSNVDTRTEEKIQEAMDRLTKGRTSFVIAHRLSTIKNADMILVMKDGNIIEQGNHESLLEQNGFYASLYNSQFALE